MTIFKDLVLPILVPTVVCAVVLILGQRLWRRVGSAWIAIGLAAGFLACQVLVDGLPAIPPRESWQWLCLLVLGAIAVGFVDMPRRLSAFLWVMVPVLFAGGCGWVLVLAGQDHLWLHRLTVAAALLVWMAALHPIAGRARGTSLSLPLCMGFIGTSLILVFSGSAKLAQLAGGFAACLGALAVLAWWRPSMALGRESIAVAGVLIVGLLYSGYSLSFSGVPLWTYTVAAAAPLAVWVVALLPANRPSGWKAVSAATLVTIVVSGIAVAGAYIAWRTEAINDLSY